MLLAWESERDQNKEGCVSFYRSKFSIWKEEDAKETTNSVEKELREARRNNSRVPKVCRRYVH